MKLITLYRVIKQSAVDFIRLPWLSLAASFMMGLTLLIIAAFLLLNTAVKKTAEALRDKVEVTVFLKDEASEELISQFADRLRSRNDVKEVSYIDKRHALELFKQQFRENPEFLTFINEDRNPLPRSLVIKTFAPEDIGNIARFIEGDDFKPIIKRLPFRDLQLFIDRLLALTRFLSAAGIVASMVFITLSIMIIFNTIALAVSTRIPEIEIMRLVGATKFFIRTPFLLLGSLYGLFGAVVSTILILLLARIFEPLLSNYLGDFSFNPALLFREMLPSVILFLFVAGVISGGFVSGLAVRRTIGR